jgi:hypothetical protein
MYNKILKFKPDVKYFTVPMQRTTDNKKLLKKKFIPDPSEEPQIAFKRSSSARFNEKKRLYRLVTI